MLKYLHHYPQSVLAKIQQLITEERLGSWLLAKYPERHSVRNNKALYDYTITLKNQYLRKSPPLNKVMFDGKIGQAHKASGSTLPDQWFMAENLKLVERYSLAHCFKTHLKSFLK